MQILFNIVYNFSIFFIFSLSFYLIYKPTKIFHISHAFTITLGGYGVYFFYNLLDINIYLSIVLALIVAILFGVLNELLFYKNFRELKDTNLKMLILSLGIYTIFQNIISIFFGDDIKTLSKDTISVGNEFFEAYITDIQIISIALAFLIFIITSLIWSKTKIGLLIRAIAINPNLAQTVGINKNSIILSVFILGSLYAGIGGILVGFNTGLTPNIGFSLLLYSIVVMIIGGLESINGLILGALILSVVQNLTAYYIDTKWLEMATYTILILFLMIRPYGVSGEKNRKIEI